jgi:uncharacterized protein YuzE
MRFELDQAVNALYVRLRSGRVERTVELTTDVYLDVDAEGLVLGAEFVNADDFLTLVRQQAGHLEIPDRIVDRPPRLAG